MGSAAEKAFGDFHCALVFPSTPPSKRTLHNYSQRCMFEGKQAVNWNSRLWHNWIIGKTISTRAPRLPGAESLFCDGLLINAFRENGESSPAFRVLYRFPCLWEIAAARECFPGRLVGKDLAWDRIRFRESCGTVFPRFSGIQGSQAWKVVISSVATPSARGPFASPCIYHI